MKPRPAIPAEHRAAQARILASALELYCANHGLARWRVGVYLFKGCRTPILKLRNTKQPTEETLRRVRAFLAEPPPPGLHRRPLGGPRVRRDCSTGAWLADKLEAFIAEHQLASRRVALHLFNSPHGITRLRELKPWRRTVLRVEAFLQHPDIASLREPVKRKPPEPFMLRPVPSALRRSYTFEEQLARVLSGQARVVTKIPLTPRGYERSLIGSSAEMVAEG